MGVARSSFESFVRWWRNYWFRESTGLRLAICRIVIVGAQLLFFLDSLQEQLMFVEPFRGFIHPQILIVAISALLPETLFPTAESITFIYWATVVAGITTLIGLFTRTSAFMFALGNWILVAHRYSYGESHHAQAILCIFLLALALSPSGRRLSVDALIRRFGRPSRRRARASWDARERIDTAIWPLELTKVLLCFAYVSNGLAKLLYGGLAWMNGYTLQTIVFSTAVSRDLPLGIWFAQHHTLAMVFSVGVILIETFFFLVLFVPRLAPLILASAALMHIGIYFTEGAAFFQYIILYVVFIPFEKLSPRVERFWQRSVGPILRIPGRWAGAAKS